MININLLVDSSHRMTDVLSQFELHDKIMDNYYNEEDQFNLFGLFQVDLDNYLKIKFAFIYHLRLQPSEVDIMPYYEYEEFIELLSDILKKKQQAEKDSASQQKSGMDPSKEAGKMMRGFKAPTMPKFK